MMKGKEILNGLTGTKRDRCVAFRKIDFTGVSNLRRIQDLSDEELLERLRVLEKGDQNEIDSLEELAPCPYFESLSDYEIMERYNQLEDLRE